MSPRPDVSVERKNQILDAATEVFTGKGFDQARMEDIAEETGLSKGTLYLYFKSKDELIIAILDRIFQREFKHLAAVDVSQMTAADSLWNFTETITRDIKLMLRLMPVAYEFLALAFRNKLVQKSLKNYLHRYMDILVPIIQRGIETGEFKTVKAQEVAIAMGSILEGTILLWVYDRSLVNPELHIRSSVRLLLEGVKS